VAYRWTNDIGMVPLGDPAGTGRSVSADGFVVAGETAGGREGFRWTAQSGVVLLGFLHSGDVNSPAEAISEDDQVIVGFSGSSDTGMIEAYRWTLATGMVGLGFLPGDSGRSNALGVSADGQVVVGESVSKAFRWTAETGMVDLGELPGSGFGTYAAAVSADGKVVVGNTSGSTPFRWTAATGMVALGSVPGADVSQPEAVSGDGSIAVGDYEAGGTFRAAIWDSVHGVRDMRDALITDFGLSAELSGWQLFEAKGISPDGRSIVGIGINPSGQVEAWLVSLRSSISGMIFKDQSGDGVMSGSDAGVQSRLVQLIDPATGAVLASQASDGSGDFTFANVGPGSYRLREVLGSGWIQTTADPADFTVDASGANLTGFLFGDFQLATITGQVFQNQNGNGTLNPGDTGLQGWTVQLLDPATGSVLATQTTDTSGNYTFSNLNLGSYRVREVTQTGWTQTTTNPADFTVITSGTSLGSVNFGNFLPVSLSGRVIDDQDGNGVQNGSEGGLQGWTIQLINPTTSAVITSQTSDMSGNYSFPNLGPGTYRLREVLQTGYVHTSASPPDSTAMSGTNVSGQNFADFKLVSVSGQLFQDLQGTGIYNGSDTGLSMWMVQLQNAPSGTVVATQTTDSGGNFTFASIGPGMYRLRPIIQAGWSQTTTNPADFTTSSGANVSGQTFGAFQLATISGQVFEDKNGDGTLNGSDAGVAGWTIQLQNPATGVVLASTTSATDGTYTFTSPGLGSYRIREVVRSGWTQTTANPANVTVTASGQHFTGIDYGDYHLGTISGQVFNDVSGSGMLSTGDSGLSGWTVQLIDPSSGMVLQSQATDSIGNYSFTSLAAGTYRVREMPQAGWQQTTANPGDMVAMSGVAAGGTDFGNFQLVSISGTVFQDGNGDGLQNDGDAGLPNWTVELLNAQTGAVVAMQQTDPAGNFSLANIGPGTYLVQQVLPAGWKQTTADPNPIPAASGTPVAGLLFGAFQLVTIGGELFGDQNGDGKLDGTDAGLSGWKIDLFNLTSGHFQATAITDMQGNYSFSGLGPGLYRVSAEAQTGWSQTTAAPGNITAMSGTSVTNADFGEVQLITIAGQVFQDMTGSGTLSPGDSGLVGWTVQVQGTTLSQPILATTDAGGAFSVTGLGPGTYTVSEIAPAGWTQTTPNPAAIPASSGNNVPDLAFGNFRNVTISGRSFADLKLDGTDDSGVQSGMNGFTVQLYRDANNDGMLETGIDTLVASAMTATQNGISGAYGFTGVGPGTYFVEETRLPNTLAVDPSTSAVYTVPAMSGTNVAQRNFGNLDTAFKCYVYQTYQDVLKRPVDLGGLNYWVSQLNAGVPRGTIAGMLTHSAEYYATNVIQPAYQQFLHRTADATGLAFWTRQLQGGMTDEQMQAGFIASNEFYQIGNHSSVPIPVTPDHDRAWVDALYLALLGRPPDQTGEDYWTNQLQGHESRLQVANGFTGSQEGLGLRVLQTYQRYLGRGASQPEIDYWVAQYHLGATNETIVTGFVSSDEYFKRSTGNL
jgi:probable HAF family extracellular repeat protein